MADSPASIANSAHHVAGRLRTITAAVDLGSHTAGTILHTTGLTATGLVLGDHILSVTAHDGAWSVADVQVLSASVTAANTFRMATLSAAGGDPTSESVELVVLKDAAYA